MKENNEIDELNRKKSVKKIVEDYPALLDLSFKGDYKKIYALAKNFYLNKWRNNEKPSPAFNNEIVKVTRRGFKHLVVKIKTTNLKNALNRLKHLPNAKQILETTNEIYETRITVNKKSKKVRQYALLGKLINGVVLKVIIHESNRNKDKTFLSVFEVIKKG